MEYLAVIFVIIIIAGLLANREIARDRKRIRHMLKEYSFRTYSPGEDDRNRPEKEEKP